MYMQRVVVIWIIISMPPKKLELMRLLLAPHGIGLMRKFRFLYSIA